MTAAHNFGSHAIVVDADTFAFVTELEIRKALRLQYYVSLLAVQPSAGRRVTIPDPSGLARRVASIVSEQLRGTDLIGLTPTPPQFHILLVNAHLESLSTIIQRLGEEVGRHVFQINGQPTPVTLTVGGACFPTTAGTRQDLVNQAVSLIADGRERRT